MNDQVLLRFKLKKPAGGLVSGKWYYYPVPAFETINGVVTRMTDDRAREIFLSDPDGYKKVLDELPAACASWVNFSDLIVPIPGELPTQASVLRVNHELNADGSFQIMAELQNAKPGDKAYVAVVGLEGTGFSQTGKYPMGVFVQQYPVGSQVTYSWQKIYSALKPGDRVEYRVYANDRLDFLSGTIQYQNTNPANGPVWGDTWKPDKVTPTMGYGGNLPENAATGTGPIYYRLVSGPSWFTFAENTRNYSANPTPAQAPATPETVTFRASDQNGSTDKVFVLEFAGMPDMYLGAGFYPGGETKLFIGIGPDEPKGFTVRLTALDAGVAWSNNSAITAERKTIGVNGVGYPYQHTYTNVPQGMFLIEAVRLRDNQKRYVLFMQDGEGKQFTAVLSPVVPPYTPAGYQPTSLGDIWELIKDEETVVERFIYPPISSLKEGAGPVTVEFRERLSPSNTTRKSLRGGSWSLPAPPSNLITLTPVAGDPVSAQIEAPQGSVTTDVTFGVRFTDTEGLKSEAIVQLQNVDSSILKPVRQTEMNDIYHNQPGSKRFVCPSPWFQNQGPLTANSWNGTSKSPLPEGVSFVGTADPAYFDIADSAPNVKLPVLITSANAAGEAADVIQLWIDRQAPVGKITGIWRSFDSNNNLNYYVHGTLLGNNEDYRVRYRQSPAGTYNGNVSTDWSPFVLICTPGESTSGPGDFYRNYGLGQAVQTRVEFQVIKPSTGEVLGPVIALDYLIPAQGTILTPQRVYSA